MHQVPFAKIIGGNGSRSIAGVLSLKHTVTLEVVVIEHEVELRRNVLRGQNTDVRLLLFLISKECSPIAELCIWGLCVELRKSLRTICPGLIWREEYCAILIFSLEEVV